MIKTKFVFAVSFVAMMAVGTGHAEIAGVSYVEQQVGVATTAANNAQTSANNANTAAGKAQTSADNAQDAADAAQDSADAAAASAKTANDAIANLDLSAVGADGSYIKTISQTNGKVSATKETADTAPTSGSKKMVTSGGVYTALNGKVNVSQGTGNAGKGLVVDGTSGDLTLIDVATQAELNVLTTANSNVSADVDTLKSDVSDLKTGVSQLDSEKQDVISDLAAIRSGATAGSTALQKADIATGTSNGTISVDGSNVAVKGLGSAAYKASSAFATADQGTKADGAVQTNQGTGNAGKGLVVDGTTGDLTLTDVATQAELNAVNTTAGNAVVANPAITGGTGTKITYDSKGLVTGSTSLAASDIPTLSSSKISNLGTISATNMGTSATTVVTAIKEVAGEAAAAQATADKAVVANAAITGGTGTKITYDSKGLVTGSTSLAASDIPTLTIGKITDLQTSLDGKQATLTTSNIKGAGSVSVGISNGVITVTGTDTNTTYSTGTATTSGLTKLYTGTGTNTDGTMTQAALNTALSGKLSTSGTAAKATKDASGNVITSTYATKTELSDGLAGKQGTLKAGANISIAADGTISATDTNTQVTVDSALSSTSTNPVQNKVINSALAGKLSTSGTAAKATKDADGNVITSTYATKTELSDGLAGKQDAISDLATIRSGATAGSTAVQTNQGTTNAGKGLVVDGTSGNLTLTDVATQAELNALTTANSNVSADVDTLKSDVSSLKTSVSQLGSEKQNVISDLAAIRSGATAGSTALQKADIATGTSNGTISVDGSNVAVKGLGSAAYKASSAFATAAQGTKADGAVQTNQTTTNANKIMITNASGSVTPVGITASGSGNVVTAVSVEGGKLTVTKGTTLGSLATKSSVASADITDGAVATADLAGGAVTTAKIADSNVTTAKIAANAVTVAKTSGIYGYIPTASDGSGAAQIWVE